MGILKAEVIEVTYELKECEHSEVSSSPGFLFVVIIWEGTVYTKLYFEIL